jgi:hypothetical protein
VPIPSDNSGRIDLLIEIFVKAIESNLLAFVLGVLVCLVILVHNFKVIDRWDKIGDLLREVEEILRKIEHNQTIKRELKRNRRKVTDEYDDDLPTDE